MQISIECMTRIKIGYLNLPTSIVRVAHNEEDLEKALYQVTLKTFHYLN